ELVQLDLELADLVLQRLALLRELLPGFSLDTLLLLAPGGIPRPGGRGPGRGPFPGGMLEQPVAIVVEIAIEGLEPVIRDEQELVGRRAQQMTVVRDDDQGALELRERHRQCVARLEV